MSRTPLWRDHRQGCRPGPQRGAPGPGRAGLAPPRRSSAPASARSDTTSRDMDNAGKPPGDQRTRTVAASDRRA